MDSPFAMTRPQPRGRGNTLVPPDQAEDTLILQYPNYEDRIRKYREAGIADYDIAKRFAGREARYLEYGIQQKDINERFGRTPETQMRAVSLTRYNRTKAFSENMKMPEKEADRVLAVADFAGISPNTLLMNKDIRDNIFKALEGQGVKIDESAIEQMRNAKDAQIIEKQLDDIYADALVSGSGDPSETKEVKALEAELQKFAPPIYQSTWQKILTGGAQFGTQLYRQARTGAKYGAAAAAAGAGVGAAAGSVIPGVGTASGAATGAMWAGGRAFAAGMVKEARTMETGSAYREFLNLRDDTGNKMDPGMARILAPGSGTASGAIEYLQLKTLAKAFTGNPAFRNRVLGAFAAAGINYGKEVSQEVAQRAVVVAGREAGKYLSGVENSDAGGVIDELTEEGVGAAQSFALMFGMGGALSAARQVMTKNKLAGAELSSEVSRLAELQRQILNGEERETVFIPKADVEAFFRESGLYDEDAAGGDMKLSRALRDYGVDAELYAALTEEDEIAIPAELFEKNPIQSPNVRRGAKGETAREQAARLQRDIEEKQSDPLYADTKEAQEALRQQKDLEKLILDAGGDPSVAHQGAELWTRHAAVAAREMGVPVKDAMKLIVQRAADDMESAAAGELAGLTQAAMYKNPAKTITEFRLNVLSGKSGKSTFQFRNKEGVEMEIASDDLIHTNREHDLTDEQWQAVIDGMDNIEAAYFIEGEKSKYLGQPIAVKINTLLGKTGVVLEMTKTGRVFLKSAFFSTDDNLDNNWIKKPRLVKGEKRTPYALETDKSATAKSATAFSTGRPLSVQSIQEALGIVKQGSDGNIYAQEGGAADSIGQIKSVNNRGTWDAGNPNIYLQAARNAQVSRTASSVSEAANILRENGIVNKPLTNNKLGITASVSGVSLKEMQSEQATRKSVSPRLHALALANLDSLFENAVFDVTHADRHERREVKQIHRLGALLKDVTNYHPVKLTVVEYVKDGNRIYTVEAVDVEQIKSAGHPNPGEINSAREFPIADFDNKILQLLDDVKKAENSFNQTGDSRVVRGMFHVDPETGARIVTLFKAQNKSTFIHEIAHAFLEDLMMMAEAETASERVQRDWDTVREWLGMGEDQARPTREQHEKFADGFLNFINDGYAPSKSLRGVFLRIKSWLTELFRAAEIQRIEMSGEVREVYARLLAAPDEVDAQFRENTTIPDITAQVTAMKEDAELTERILDELNDEAGIEDLMGRFGEQDDETAFGAPDDEFYEGGVGESDIIDRGDQGNGAEAERVKDIFQTESGRSVEDADPSELLLKEDGSPDIGAIDEKTASNANVASGEIRATVRALQHAERNHGGQIRQAGYGNAQTLIADVLINYSEIRQGNNTSLFLVKRAEGTKSSVVVVELEPNNGFYWVKTAWLPRNDYLDKKRLLSARSATPATLPDSGLAFQTGQSDTSGSTGLSARQKNNLNTGSIPQPDVGSNNLNI
ncbi:hypothetical protein FACS1894216_19530 [Synergistales bacterium]|nr:hypothetical protein FACS1894216_19530 [Synergistales bacterium]